MLRDFWAPFQQQIEDAGQISVREVIDELDALLGPHLFQLQVYYQAPKLKPWRRRKILVITLLNIL